jgi:hypothetical protein
MGARRPSYGLVAGLVVAFAITLTPSGAAAKDGTVRINAPGADSRSVTVRLAELGSFDINNQEYVLSTGRKPISGFSISKVLEAASGKADGWLDLETLPSVRVDRPSGSAITLSRSQIFGSGDRPPVFYPNNDTTVFVMPGNPGQEYTFRLAPVGVKVGLGEAYELSVSPTSVRVDRGERVTFTAKVGNRAGGETLNYRWSVQGTTRANGSGNRFGWTFRREGRFSVLVTVTGTRQSNTALAAVTVGNPPEPPKKKRPESSPAPQSVASSSAGPPGTGGIGGFGGTPGAGEQFGGGGEFDFPAPESDREGESRPESDLPLISGELLGPDVEVTEITPGSETDSAEQKADESGGFGLPGEAWTLFGVGLLLGLGGFIELRVLSRIG